MMSELPWVTKSHFYCQSVEAMKYNKILEKISNGTMSRADLQSLKLNAIDKFVNGDQDAEKVIAAISVARPVDAYILFMGFCPNADFNDRQDTEWKERGICRFDWPESGVQQDRFDSICTGDLVVLKKREKFGKTMKVYGHGRVISIAYDSDNIRYLGMNWSEQSEVQEVPLMGCNSTVDIRSMDVVEEEMPIEFWVWLGRNCTDPFPRP